MDVISISIICITGLLVTVIAGSVVVFVGCLFTEHVRATPGVVIPTQADESAHQEANHQFGQSCPAIRRRELERLIANCIDTPSSTLFEALAQIERDAQSIDLQLREQFLAQFKSDSIAVRAAAVRKLLEEQYLPKALNE